MKGHIAITLHKLSTAITLHKLKDIVAQAYVLGYHGCLNMKDSIVDQLIEDLITLPNVEQFSINDGWRIFTIKELHLLTTGVIVDHSSRGKGYVVRDRSPFKSHIIFDICGPCYFLSADMPPWTEPMRIVNRRKHETL